MASGGLKTGGGGGEVEARAGNWGLWQKHLKFWLVKRKKKNATMTTAIIRIKAYLRRTKDLNLWHMSGKNGIYCNLHVWTKIVQGNKKCTWSNKTVQWTAKSTRTCYFW